MKHHLNRRLFAAVLAAVLSLGTAVPGRAADVVTIQVGYGAGGSYDMAARLVGRHLGRFLPGTPEIVVQNVPGGGSLKLAQLLLGAVPADGSVIGAIGPGTTLAAKLDPENVQFDPQKLRWLGSLGTVESFCAVSRTTGIETLEDFTSKEFHIGASGKSSTTYLFAALAKNALGAKFDIVTGFDGVAAIELAMERGEVAGHCTFDRNDIARRGLGDTMNMILRFGRGDGGEYNAVPRVTEKIADPAKKQAAEMVESLRDYDFPLVAPAGTPDDVVAALRAAFDAMVKDPEFIAEVEKHGEFRLQPTSGAELERMLAERLSADPAVFETMRQLVR
jgi:tripartite-type tricarboxylate transporter receptor subunit TctC